MPFVLPYLFFFGEKQKGQRFHKIKYIEQKQKENCKKKVLKKPDYTFFYVFRHRFLLMGFLSSKKYGFIVSQTKTQTKPYNKEEDKDYEKKSSGIRNCSSIRN